MSEEPAPVARNILIVGATSAIAAACARRWAGEGSAFFLLARDAEKLRQTADDLAVLGAAAVHCHVLDLNDFAQHAAALDQCFGALGKLDVALVAHGSLPDQRACEQDTELALREFSSNALSVIALLTPLANRMRAQGFGTIAVISSVAGERGRASNYVYGAAKAAVSAFCQGLRARLRGSGVKVLTIKPGLVATPMTRGLPLPAMLVAKPERVANDILRAIRRGSGTLYTPWFWAPIMLAVRLAPDFVFRRKVGAGAND
jgi:decaprenylphospho-beta-D-erythro-pentofuranosid-2-ulose 2-reductase